MRKIFALIVLLSFTYSTFCQSGFWIEASGTYSFIPKSEEYQSVPSLPVTTFPVSDEFVVLVAYESKPGFDLLAGFSKELGSQFNIEIGFGYAQYYFQQSKTVERIETNSINQNSDIYPSEELLPGDIKFIDEDPPINERIYFGSTDNIGKTSVSYLNIPLAIQYVLFDRMIVGLGIHSSILLYSKELKSSVHFSESSIPVNYPTNYWTPQNPDMEIDGNRTGVSTLEVYEYEDKSGTGLTNTLWQGEASINFRLFNELWLRTAYQHSFSPLYNSQTQFSSTAKYRTIKLGLRFYF